MGEVGFFEDEEIEEDLFTLYSDEYLIKPKMKHISDISNTEPLKLDFIAKKFLY
jgi:hypothetical protein